MVLFGDEAEVWKCPKHPSWRRRSGICPVCLRDRLLALCPDCGNVRPCACFASSSSSSSSSSSFSLLSVPGIGTVGRVSSLIDGEPAFRRSRSTAPPFLRSRLGSGREYAADESAAPAPVERSGKASFWSSLFRAQRTTKKREGGDGREAESRRRRRMMRSRSVGVLGMSDSGAVDGRSKGRGWSFSSPLSVFRRYKTSNAPLCTDVKFL